MRGDEAIAAAERGLTEAVKQLARRCGGVVREEEGLLLVAGNHPCPVLVNSAMRTGVMEAGEVLRRAAKFFGEIGNHWETWAREGTDEDIERAAQSAGMRAAAELSGMMLFEKPEAPEAGTEVAVEKVEEMRGVREFTSVAAEAFQDEAPGLPELVRAMFSDPRSLIASDTAAFVVRERGEPVSVAMTIVRKSVAWIGWVATRPAARGRGLGNLATAAASRAGFEMGAECASLEATKMGAPVYRRLGYREVMRYRTYWPANFLK
ncbi:MAG: GNAT family N-acetyltransferase [Candidatus Acidiferrales bacterium]